MKQCVCNYTFEYGKVADAARPAGADAGRASITPFVVGVALVAAVAAAAWFNATAERGDRSRPELALLLVAIGVFSACGAIFDWSFFLANRKARLIMLALGRTGARFVYAALGGGLAGVGLAMALG